jgi:hypothetical protein
MEAARSLIQTRADALVERLRCDAGVVALALEADVVHVACVGPVRAYLRRLGQVRRLSPRDDRAEEGLLKQRPVFSSERIEPGDLIVAGSLAAFCNESLQRVGLALAEDQDLSPAAVTALLNKSAAEGRRGVSSVALRIPKF